MTQNSRPPIALFAAAGLLSAAAIGIAYSALAVDHRRRLPPPLIGKQIPLETPGGRIMMYEAEGEGTPLLLIHSINAAASAYEMQPLFQHYAGERPIYAIDLPGFGLSERRDQTYTPRIMVDAIHAAVAEIRSRHQGAGVDLMALSLSCEYAARAALEQHEDIRSLALISPTAFGKALAGYGRAQSTKGNPVKLAVISIPVWSQALFDLVVSRSSPASSSAKRSDRRRSTRDCCATTMPRPISPVLGTSCGRFYPATCSPTMQRGFIKP